MKKLQITKKTKNELASKGFKTGTVAEFLELSPADEAWIEMKRAVEVKSAQPLQSPAT